MIPLVDETTDESILYDLLEYFVWEQEPELIVSRRNIIGRKNGTHVKSWVKKYHNWCHMMLQIHLKTCLTKLNVLIINKKMFPILEI